MFGKGLMLAKPLSLAVRGVCDSNRFESRALLDAPESEQNILGRGLHTLLTPVGQKLYTQLESGGSLNMAESHRTLRELPR